MDTVADVQESDCASEPPTTNVETSMPTVPTKLWHIILIAFISIIFTAIFLILYSLLNNVIWFNTDFMTTNRWMIPVLVLAFSLGVGLCQKYLRAPTAIHGSFVDSLKGSGEKADYRTFPGALLSSLFSLLSGASIGPEGSVVVL